MLERLHRASGSPGQAEASFETPAGRMTGTYLAEEIEVLDAEVLGSFVSGRTTGLPALTSRRHSGGRAVYLATVPTSSSMRTLLGRLLAEAGVRSDHPDLPEYVETARRGNVITVINHGGPAVTVGLDGVELTAGRPVSHVTLAPYEFAMVRIEENRAAAPEPGSERDDAAE